jgi:hypothetical protein
MIENREILRRPNGPLPQESVLENDSKDRKIKRKRRKEQSTTSPHPQIVQEEDLEEGALDLGENGIGKDDWQFEPFLAEFYFLQSGVAEPCK